MTQNFKRWQVARDKRMTKDMIYLAGADRDDRDGGGRWKRCRQKAINNKEVDRDGRRTGTTKWKNKQKEC